ncbi:MAG: ABC transporter permease [Prevotella sp.]|nr:ABC transporter permease [Prevotella sp.]
MRKILNNIWSQRTNNVWLFLELIVVCFVAWTQLDPIIVRLYYRSLPSGIDGDRMVVANILSTRPYDIADNSMTQEERDNQYWKREAEYGEEANVIKLQLLAIDGVEQASIADPVMGIYARTDLFSSPGGFSNMLRYAWQNDTVLVNDICYAKDEHFFETYGIQPIAGCKTSKELSDIDQGWIVSQSLAEYYFGSPEAAINKELHAAFFADGDWHQPIVAVVNDVHVSEKDYNTWAVYSNNGTIRTGGSQNLIVLRLKPGINPRRFAEEQNYHAWNYASDNYAVASFTAYDDIGSSRNQFATPSLSYDFNLQIATAVFFLINLCLGVIGTFWMQTKRRTEESGIMRAFGATKRRIMSMFLAEGWVLATVSMFIACVLYLNYVKMGFGELCISTHQPGTQPDPTWVADKPLHFLIVSAIVYLIIICTVLIGTAIPAWRICRSEITNALKDE